MDTQSRIRMARAYLLAVGEPRADALAAFVAEHGPACAAEAARFGNVPAEVKTETEIRRELELPPGSSGGLSVPGCG